MITAFGLTLNVIDVGWPAGAAATIRRLSFLCSSRLTSPISGCFTRTVNVDIWNYWHYAFIETPLIANVTNNIMWLCCGNH